MLLLQTLPVAIPPSEPYHLILATVEKDGLRFPVGTVTVHQIGQELAGVSRLFVREDYRKQGIASALLDEAARFCRDAGSKRFNLLVELQNLERLRPFYEKRGFVLVYQFTDGDVCFSKNLITA